MTPTPAERAALVAQHLHLVRVTAAKLVGVIPSNEWDDLQGAGRLGLAKAVAKYDGRPTVKFRTYAITCIRGEIWEYLRDLDHLSRDHRKKVRGRELHQHELPAVSLDELVSTPDEEGLTVADRLADSVDVEGTALGRVEREALWQVVASLEGQDALILRRYYRDGWSVPRIAREIGVSSSQAYVLRDEALGRLREVLEGASE